jgi:hypothetical protein
LKLPGRRGATLQVDGKVLNGAFPVLYNTGRVDNYLNQLSIFDLNLCIEL